VVVCDVDLVMGPMRRRDGDRLLRAHGWERVWDPSRVMFALDPLRSAIVRENGRVSDRVRAFARRYGIELHEVEQESAIRSPSSAAGV